MKKLTNKQLKELMKYRNNQCISLYLPVHEREDEIKRDSLTFKHLVDTVVETLKKKGMDNKSISLLIEPLRDFTFQDINFWRKQEKGFGLFLAPSYYYYISLPFNVKPLAIISSRFHIKPLIRYLSDSELFYLLTFSKNTVKFYSCTKFSIDDTNVENLPDSLDAVLHEAAVPSLQFHPMQNFQRKHNENLIFYGQGYNREYRKDKVLRFFRIIDSKLHSVLKDKQAPLLLAGVNYYLALYKEANTYPFLYNGIVEGNPEKLDKRTLHTKAWNVIKEYFDTKKESDILRYVHADPEMVASDIKEIGFDSYEGLIDTLFVAESAAIWGSFDEVTGKAVVHELQSPGDEDLTDFAAEQTWLNGGNIYIVDRKRMPEHQDIAAILRY